MAGTNDVPISLQATKPDSLRPAVRKTARWSEC